MLYIFIYFFHFVLSFQVPLLSTKVKMCLKEEMLWLITGIPQYILGFETKTWHWFHYWDNFKIYIIRARLFLHTRDSVVLLGLFALRLKQICVLSDERQNWDINWDQTQTTQQFPASFKKPWIKGGGWLLTCSPILF